MDNLTSRQREVFNNLSLVVDSEIYLGNTLQSIIDSLGEKGTPVNAVAASATLNITGVVSHGEKVSINNPSRSGSDVYEFLADVAQTKSNPDNIGVNILASAVAADGELTMDTQPTAGDKVTLGTKVYTFVPVGTDTADGEISIGTDLAEAQAAFVAAVNGTDNFNTKHPLVSASDFVANVCNISARIYGVEGNAIATTETFTAATNVFAAATLANGSSCSAANAITALVAAIVANDTQGVGAVDGTGDSINFTADVAGAYGNLIEISETLANGAFANTATTFAGGIDGTVSEGFKILVDSSYLYICIDENSISDANWRRISVGSAF